VIMTLPSVLIAPRPRAEAVEQRVENLGDHRGK
jgi:hypothetical protein